LEGCVPRKGEKIKECGIIGRESEGKRPLGKPRGRGYGNYKRHVK